MQTIPSSKLSKKELIKSEPYVIYDGFELGKFPKTNALKELKLALQSFYEVAILVNDQEFSNDLLEYIQQGFLSKDQDAEIFQKANLLIDTTLVSSLPENATHPALLHLKNNFENDVSTRVAPKLIQTQVQAWGLKHERIKAFSRVKLEQEVA